MKTTEELIQETVAQIEKLTEEECKRKYNKASVPPDMDMFKASMMSEIGRRIKNRAHKLEENYIQARKRI